MSRFAALALLVAAACAGARGAAESAITAADRAIAALPADAAKVAPEEVAPLTQAMARARDLVAKGEYDSALAGAREIPPRAQALASRLPGLKAALTAAMDTLSIAMPRNLAAIKTRLDTLNKSKRLPRGMDAQQVQAARDTYAAATAAWEGITASFKAGDLASAMKQALELKARVSQSLLGLGLTADERAWSNVTLPPKQ
jgi:hypothetical protein